MADLPRAMTERPALLLHKLGQLVVERAEPRFARLGVTGRQYVILAILGSDRPASQVDIATLCNLAPAQIVVVLDELEQAGLAERRRDEQDRRRSVVRLTAEGERVLAQADAVGTEIEDQIFAGVDDADRERMLAVLRDGLAGLVPQEA